MGQAYERAHEGSEPAMVVLSVEVLGERRAVCRAGCWYFCTFFLFVVVLIRGYEHRKKELVEEREWTCASGDAQEAPQKTREGL
jgi:hypothetical protein